jgi:hypothetical protein
MSTNSNDEQEAGAKSLASAFSGGLSGFSLGGGLGGSIGRDLSSIKRLDMTEPKIAEQKPAATHGGENKHAVVHTQTAKTTIKPHGPG